MFRLAVISLGLFAAVASAQPSFPEPKTYPPDAATLKETAAKTVELRKAVKGLPKFDADVEVYLKAAEWTVRHGEWYSANAGKQTLDVLAAGLGRAKAAKEGKKPWLDARGKPIGLGYRSGVDESVQPYSLAYPADFDPKKKYWLEVVLHGRDATLTEVKFLAGKESAKPNPKLDHFVLEVYGRGNNAYRWAGETDITEVIPHAKTYFQLEKVLFTGIVLRGFSMGGAGTWHYGLHHSGDFAAIGPGAGFTATRGYIKNLKEPLPDYIDKCLHIYDAVDYAENAFNVPVVAYSGENDDQKAAADNVEKALKGYKEPHSFTHFVAPGLKHQQPPEWVAKQDAELRKHVAARVAPPDRIRLVTYTAEYGRADWLMIDGLEEHYVKAVADARREKGTCTITTENVRRLSIATGLDLKRIIIDGIEFDPAAPKSPVPFVKRDGKWSRGVDPEIEPIPKGLEKRRGIQGPIDAAFLNRFTVFKPTRPAWFPEMAKCGDITLDRFETLWDKHLRGRFTDTKSGGYFGPYLLQSNCILFGDPGSSADIEAMLPKLPIKWTKDELIVNGVKYDPKTHYPAMIYPNPFNSAAYVVLNSGHTFKDADFRGTNALLYPRLGDWAVLKPKPAKDDPGAVEVVAAGIFDEFWQFKKAKK